MKVFLGADHGGFELKNQISEHLIHRGYELDDCGAQTLDPDDDEPQFAFAVATKLLGEEKPAFGILVCRSGIGMALAANRVAGIRAAIAWSPAVARMARIHNDANILCLPADFIDPDTALVIVDDFLSEKFSHKPRYVRRIKQVEDLY